MVDYLAVKKLPIKLREKWKIAPHISYDEKVEAALGSCADTNSNVREYIGRTLQNASVDLLNNSQIINALDALVNDTDETVRNSVAWWNKK